MTVLNEDPDYSTYSLRDLRDVERHIDQSRFPERYERLRAELRRREAIETDSDEADDQPYREADFPDASLHKRLSAILIGEPALFTLFQTGLAVATQGLDSVLARPEVSARLLIGSVFLQMAVVFAAGGFYRQKRWPRYLLWPVAVLTALSLSGKAPIGIYAAWVLWRSRPVRTEGASSAA